MPLMKDTDSAEDLARAAGIDVELVKSGDEAADYLANTERNAKSE